MAVNDTELTVVITGRYPNLFLANGFPIFVEQFTPVEEPTDSEFDIDVGGTTYHPSLNLGFPRGTLEQQAVVGVGNQSKDTSGFGAQYDRVASLHYRNFDGEMSKALVLFQNLESSI